MRPTLVRVILLVRTLDVHCVRYRPMLIYTRLYVQLLCSSLEHSQIYTVVRYAQWSECRLDAPTLLAFIQFH